MKKFPFIFIILFVNSCSSGNEKISICVNEQNETALKINIQSISEIAVDDSSRLLNGSLTSISYLNYEFLVAGINDTFQNLTHFLSLNPSMITTNFLAPDPFFELRYYSIDESKYINPKLCEMFFMYDESIGWSHPYFDGYDYSVSFICIFFPTSNIINELRINYQKTNSITTDKLTILCEEEVIGYIYAYHGENDVFDYVANYLKQNLVIL